MFQRLQPPLVPLPLPMPLARIPIRRDVSIGPLIAGICGLGISFTLLYLVGRRRLAARKLALRSGKNRKNSQPRKTPRIKT